MKVDLSREVEYAAESILRYELNSRGTLSSSLRVHIRNVLLSVGGCREDHIRNTRPSVAMGTDIHHLENIYLCLGV